MTNKIPIIAFSVHPWEEPQWMNRQHLLSRLAERGWPVYYCSGPLNWWERHGSRWENSNFSNRYESLDGVTVIHAGKSSTIWKRSDLISKFSMKRYINYVKRVAGINDENFIFAPFHPAFHYLSDIVGAKYTYFHAYDLYWKMEKWDLAKYEEFYNFVHNCDLITSCADVVRDEILEITGVGSQLLLNAADVGMFNNEVEKEPEDLAKIDGVKIVNIGSVNGKMDLPMITALAERKPEWQWVFVGRVESDELSRDPYNSFAFKKIKSMGNVYFLGEKNRKLIPSYIKHVDILTICYRTDGSNWGYAGFPLKLVEYLASGKPTITSNLLSVNKYFSEFINVANSDDEWVQAIEAILVGNDISNSNAKISEARKHSWDKRTDQLEYLLENMIVTK